MHKTTSVIKYLQALNLPIASLFLILLFCGDLIFIVLDCVDVLMPGERNPLLKITEDGGYPEMYQYLKLFLITALLTLTSWKKRSQHYLVWVLIFVYFLCDDSLRIHERVGRIIAVNINFFFSLESHIQDLGELTITAAVGIFFLFLLMWAFRSGSMVFRKISLDLCILVLVLIFFGVVVDMVHSVINLGREINFILAVIEDGGEMFAVSFILWYTILLTLRDDSVEYYLYDLLRIVLSKSHD